MKNRASARRNPCLRSGELLVGREKHRTYFTSKIFAYDQSIRFLTVSHQTASRCYCLSALVLPNPARRKRRFASIRATDPISSQTSNAGELAFGFALELLGESFDFFGFLVHAQGKNLGGDGLLHFVAQFAGELV